MYNLNDMHLLLYKMKKIIFLLKTFHSNCIRKSPYFNFHNVYYYYNIISEHYIRKLKFILQKFNAFLSNKIFYLSSYSIKLIFDSVYINFYTKYNFNCSMEQFVKHYYIL